MEGRETNHEVARKAKSLIQELYERAREGEECKKCNEWKGKMNRADLDHNALVRALEDERKKEQQNYQLVLAEKEMKIQELQSNQLVLAEKEMKIQELQSKLDQIEQVIASNKKMKF